MSENLRKVENLVIIPITRAFVCGAPEEVTLAPRLVRELRASPPPERDEWGLRPHSLIWVLFHPEGSEPRDVAAEESDEHSQWVNAFSIISPKEKFLEDWERELKNHLRYLFEGDEVIERKQDILYRISAS